MLAKLKRIWYITPELQKKFIWSGKFFISALTFAYVFYKISNHAQLEDLTRWLTHFDSIKLFLLFTTLILAIPNWLLESIKWKKLTSKVHTIDIWQATKAVFGGLSVSLLTPNRIGEIPGRAAFMPLNKQPQTILVSAFGSLSQSMVTAIAGFAAYFILKARFSFNLLPQKTWHMALFVILSLILLAVFFLFFTKSKWSFKGKILTLFNVIKEYTLNDFITINLLSVVRYAIFTTQFYILLRFFNIEIGILESYSSIALTYLILYLTPFLSIAEIGARGSASLLCIGFFSPNVTGILLAGFSIWLINIMIPAMIGSFLILQKNKA